MSSLKKLIHEIHRRSLWQVLGIYLVGSWGVLQVVEVVTESAGLPDWTPGFALVLLLIGLPVCMATAFVQEGAPGRMGSTTAPEPGEYDAPSPPKPVPNLATGTGSLDRPTTRPPFIKRFLTWRKAILGGLAASALLMTSVFGYLFMWSQGIGPVGSLVAQGVFDEGESVVLAEFENTSDDPSLGKLVTETLRIDLANSASIHVLTPTRVSEVLERMQQPDDVVVSATLAREIALREGVKAVIEGSVGSAGEGYLLLATVRGAADGQPLASLRRTARSSAEVIDAIDGLSQDIRERAGESLRSIKSEAPLEAVTTRSMDALQRFVRANEATESGDFGSSIALLREAVALDPGFAMAYRKMAADLFNAGRPFAEIVEAATRAYELRDRLTEREALLTAAQYHNRVTLDAAAEIRAYESVLERFPDDPAALNNLSNIYGERGRYEEAVELLERAVGGAGESASAHTNRVFVKLNVGDTAGAREALRAVEEKYSHRPGWTDANRFALAWRTGDLELAHEVAQAISDEVSLGPGWYWVASHLLNYADAIGGRFSEALEHADRAISDLTAGGVPDLVSNAVLDGAFLDLAAGRQAEARARLTDALESGIFDAPPVEARDYLGFSLALAWAGDTERARALVERAAEELPAVRETAIAEGRRRVDVVLTGLESDPSAGLAALDQLRRSAGCPSCWAIDAALLADAADEPSRAAEEYEEVMRVVRMAETRRYGAAMALRRLGPIYEELGQVEDAIIAYARLAAWWAEADPDRQPIVRDARARLVALQSRERSGP